MAAEQPSVSEAVGDIAQSSQEALRAAERISTDLEALERKFEHATDWRARVRENPLWIVGGAIFGGLLLWRIFR